MQTETWQAGRRRRRHGREDRWREMEKVVAGWEQGQMQTRGRGWKKDGDEGNFMSLGSERRS